MKTIKLIALSIISILSFCSCQKEAEKLCIGYFDVDSDASYVVKDNKRQYVSELEDEKAISSLCFGGKSKIVKVYFKNGNAKESKMFFDEDCFIVDGETYRIIESSPHILIFESNKRNSDNFIHIELKREESGSHAFWRKLFFNYVYLNSTQGWLHHIIAIIAILLMIFIVHSISNKDTKIVVAIVCALFIIFFVYLKGTIDGQILASYELM